MYPVPPDIRDDAGRGGLLCAQSASSAANEMTAGGGHARKMPALETARRHGNPRGGERASGVSLFGEVREIYPEKSCRRLTFLSIRPKTVQT